MTSKSGGGQNKKIEADRAVWISENLSFLFNLFRMCCSSVSTVGFLCSHWCILSIVTLIRSLHSNFNLMSDNVSWGDKFKRLYFQATKPCVFVRDYWPPSRKSRNHWVFSLCCDQWLLRNRHHLAFYCEMPLVWQNWIGKLWGELYSTWIQKFTSPCILLKIFACVFMLKLIWSK